MHGKWGKVLLGRQNSAQGKAKRREPKQAATLGCEAHSQLSAVGTIQTHDVYTCLSATYLRRFLGVRLAPGWCRIPFLFILLPPANVCRPYRT